MSVKASKNYDVCVEYGSLDKAGENKDTAHDNAHERDHNLDHP